MPRTRRELLRRIGAGTAVVGTAGVTAASPFEEDESGGPARARVLHASPDAPAVDVFVNGSAVLTGVTFKTISDYLELPAGEYDVAVAPAGAGLSNAVIDATLSLQAGTDYTVAAANRLANIAPVVFVDDNDVEFFDTSARLRVVHLSPDAPGVDVALTDGPRVVFGPEVVVEGLTYQNATGYLDLLPVDYGFEIRPAGSETAVFDFGAEFDPGATYTVFAVGLLNPSSPEEGFDVVLSEDVPPLPERARRDAGRGELDDSFDGRGRGRSRGR